MNRCPECEKESRKNYVCTNCGLVFDVQILELKKLNKREKDTPEPLYNEFFGPLSPDMEYRHLYATKSNSSELNRALKIQKKKYSKSEEYHYNKDYAEIGRISSALQLPMMIRHEALNVRLQIGKKNIGYFKKKNQYRCIAAIKLACRIHDCPINEKDLISLTRISSENGEIINLRNNETKRKIDKEYINLRKLLGPNFKFPPIPNKPKFISYACNQLGLDQEFESNVFELYALIKKSFRPEYSLKGYILAIIYLLDEKRIVKFKDLESKFNISSATLLSRRKEILFKWAQVISDWKESIIWRGTQ